MPPTTLSARFDEKELDLLKKAADAKQWSLAQLIRVAAQEKAAHILNSVGDGRYSVRLVLGRVVRQLFKPDYTLRDPDGEAISYEAWSELSSWCNIHVSKFDESDLESLLRAVRSLGAETAPLLEDEFRRANASEAKLAALIDPATLNSEPFEVSLESTTSEPQRESKSEATVKNGMERKAVKKSHT